MIIVDNAAELAQILAPAKRVAFVPTMGNLHDGHLSLCRIARQHGDVVVTSIFVNRLQFGPNEDFDRYPRTMEADQLGLAREGVDVLFAPMEHEMYPTPQVYRVQPPPLAEELEGASRPGFFHGVCTVVLKLFHLVQPDVAIFGKKDYQQLLVLQQLVRQLNFGMKVVPGETVRESDGLAMSSRNGYLNAAERKTAVGLYTNLKRIKDAIEGGSREYDALRRVAVDALDADGWRVDYVELRDTDRLDPPKPEDTNLRVIGAAWLGKTRLIDNVPV